MRYNLLGPLEVIVNGVQLPVRSINQRAALAYLLLHANDVVASSQLARAIWGDDAPPTSRKMIQNAASSLRKMFASRDPAENAAQLLTRSPGYLLSVSPESVDHCVFQDLVGRARDELAVDGYENAARLLREALSLWRGPVLADLAEAGFDWPEANAVQNARLTAFEDLAHTELALGRHRELLGELEAIYEAEPGRERLCGQLMLALYRCSRQSDALLVFQRTRSELVERFGLDPGRELRMLERAILNHDPTLDLADNADGCLIKAHGPELSPKPDPDHAEQVLRERKWVSVLMLRVQLDVPMAGSDPEHLDDVLRGLKATITTEVAGFGGVVNGIVGSMWSVLFGAPKTREDDPERAVRAALAIQARLSHRSAVGLGPVGPVELSMHAVVATGEVMTTCGDDQGGPPAEVTGAVLNRAQHLLALVPAGQVWLCHTTSRAVEGTFGLSESPDVADVCAVTGPLPVLAGTPPVEPLIERDSELDMLRGVLLKVLRNRRPHLVTVLGEPGIGKSRLVGMLERLVAGWPDRVKWLRGQVPSFGRDSTVRALAETARSYVGLKESDLPSVAEGKLTQAARRLEGPCGRPDWTPSQLRALACLHDREPDLEDIKQTFATWQRFLEDVAAQQPLVVVLEDLHRTTGCLLDFVGNLADRVGAVPLLVIATARPELLRAQPHWGGGKRNATTLTLDPLSQHAIEQLVHSLTEDLAPAGKRPAGHDDAPRWLPRSLIDRVGGNPLFAREYVRMLQRRVPSVRTALPSGRQVPDTGRDDVCTSLPLSVYVIIAAWLDSLPSAEKEVLRDAAVLGETVWGTAVVAISGQEPATVTSCLEQLEQKEVLARVRRSSVPGDVEYAFRHALVRDVAYSQLPRSVQITRHVSAAAWLEGLASPLTDLLRIHVTQARMLSATAAGTSRPIRGATGGTAGTDRLGRAER